MSDRIAVMNRGKVEQLGTPEALYERPATRFVADFIGTTNLLRGEVVSTEADCAIVRLESGETVPGRPVRAHRRRRGRHQPSTGGDLAPRTRAGGGWRRRRADRRSVVALRRDRAGRLPWRLGPISGPHRWRIRDDGPGTEGRRQASDRKSRSPVLAARRGARPRRSTGSDGGDAVTYERDGSPVDLERRLVQVMAENRMTRRQLLERMGAVGIAAALAPIVAACSSAGLTSPSPSASAAAAIPSTNPTSGPERLGRREREPVGRGKRRGRLATDPGEGAHRLQLGLVHRREHGRPVRGQVRRSR